jgi:hypothetical protein
MTLAEALRGGLRAGRASNHLPVLEHETVVDYDPGSWQISGVIPSNHNMVRATIRLP